MTRAWNTCESILLNGEHLKDFAKSLGFARQGIAQIGSPGRDEARLKQWLIAGRHGQMEWMERTVDVRVNPRHEGMLPSARSVLIVAAPYVPGGVSGVRQTLGLGRIAKYALGRDYHSVLEKRLRKVAAKLRSEGHLARACVDRHPVLERAWAQRAGVGFVGKNCCLIVPGIGSHVFLGAVVTSADLTPDEPMKERCGDCDLCLRECPTSAFKAPRELDARRCVSYLTIEHRGDVSDELSSQVGDWLFGCDDCQDVCPFNQGSGQGAEMLSAFERDPRWDDVQLSDWVMMTEDEFEVLTRGTPLKRPGVVGLARNAAIVLGNRGGKRHLPVLEQAAVDHPDAAVRGAADWAAKRIRGRRETAPSQE